MDPSVLCRPDRLAPHGWMGRVDDPGVVMCKPIPDSPGHKICRKQSLPDFLKRMAMDDDKCAS